MDMVICRPSFQLVSNSWDFTSHFWVKHVFAIFAIKVTSNIIRFSYEENDLASYVHHFLLAIETLLLIYLYWRSYLCLYYWIYLNPFFFFLAFSCPLASSIELILLFFRGLVNIIYFIWFSTKALYYWETTVSIDIFNTLCNDVNIFPSNG